MRSASRGLSTTRDMGRPLPRLDALSDLHDGYFRFRFRSAQTTVISGEPGTQKSGLALWLCSQWNLPTLYFCADTDEATAFCRLTAALSGDTTETVDAARRSGNGGAYDDILAASNIRFQFNPEPEFEDIEQEIDAWVEAWDDYPHVIVIDNLLDVIPPSGDNEFTGYKVILLEAKKIARRTGAAVLVLHHMSETEGSDGRAKKPPARKRLMGKASQTPENVLSLALYDDEMLISAVKHRNGPSDRTGERFERLRVHAERNSFSRWVSLDEQVNGIRRYWEEIDKDG